MKSDSDSFYSVNSLQNGQNSTIAPKLQGEAGALTTAHCNLCCSYLLL